jgi:type 1 glutamine amidotransferase
VLSLLLVVPAAPAQHRVPGGAKLLLFSGGQRDHHAFRRQAQLLQKLLEDTKQFEVTICEDAALLETPALAKYDLIVATADHRDDEHRLTEGQQRALLQYVASGKGFFSLHAFCCADKTWLPEMRDLLGGVLAHFGTPNTRVNVAKFPLKITDPGHAITRGVQDFEHEDELYWQLQTRGELKPLVVATYQGADWPVVWTREYGKGRVCVNIFGHCSMGPQAKDPLEHEPFQRLVLQGIAWAAGRELPPR